jgi:hypothetical protein
MAVVYRHIRLDKNETFYIGIGKTKERAYKTTSRNSYWKNIVDRTQYSIEILFEDLSWEEAQKKEKELIELYGRKDIGTGILSNMTDGGDGLNNPSEETLVKMSQSHKGKKLTVEHKHKISENSGKKGISNFWGNHTQEAIELIRLSSTNRKHKLDSIKKMRDTKSAKPIFLIDETKTLKFGSISSCIKDFFNINQYPKNREFEKVRSGIRDVLSGRQKTYKRFSFSYVENKS